MCNAYNHPPGCTCGWGGEGHLGQTFNVPVPAMIRAAPVRWEGEDFTHPTTCPECGASVFFIRHNGGSVWVDALGWPWPKHGCFDKPNESTRDFGNWSRVATGLTNPRLGVVLSGKEKFRSAVRQLRIRTDGIGFVHVAVDSPHPVTDWIGAIVILSSEDGVLKHPIFGTFRFARFTQRSSVYKGWVLCPTCERSFVEGTAHDCRPFGDAPIPIPKPRKRVSPQPSQRPTPTPKYFKTRKNNHRQQKAPNRKVKLDLEGRIRQSMEQVIVKSWAAVGNNNSEPQKRVKQEALRLISMLSPSVKGQVEHRLSMNKWALLMSRAP